MKLYGLEIPFVEAVELSRRHTQIFSDAGCASCTGVCCRHCAVNNGYIRQDLYVTREELEELRKKYGWTDEHGFRGRFGCTLPTTHRSPTCVAYYCAQPGNEALVEDVKHLAVGLHKTAGELATILPEVREFRDLLTELVNDPAHNPPR